MMNSLKDEQGNESVLVELGIDDIVLKHYSSACSVSNPYLIGTDHRN